MLHFVLSSYLMGPSKSSISVLNQNLCSTVNQKTHQKIFSAFTRKFLCDWSSFKVFECHLLQFYNSFVSMYIAFGIQKLALFDMRTNEDQ